MADLAEIVRLSGVRHWVEQQDNQGKHSLGWSQDHVRADRAMRRHWTVVQWALACCWWAETRTPTAASSRTPDVAEAAAPADERGEKAPPETDPRGRGRGAAGRWRYGECGAWLEPALILWRWWRAWSTAPAPPPLQALLDWLHLGHPLRLCDAP